MEFSSGNRCACHGATLQLREDPQPAPFGIGVDHGREVGSQEGVSTMVGLPDLMHPGHIILQDKASAPVVQE